MSLNIRVVLGGLVFVALLIGIILGVYLVGQRQKLKSKASVGESVVKTAFFDLQADKTSLKTGETFRLNISLRSETDPANLVSVKLKYPKDKLSVESLKALSYEPDQDAQDASARQLDLSNYQPNHDADCDGRLTEADQALFNQGAGFIKTWFENFYDNNSGEVSLIGGLPSPGHKTTSGKPTLVACAVFKTLTRGQAKISLEDGSEIFRDIDSQDILAAKGDISFDISDILAPSQISYNFSPGWNFIGIAHTISSPLSPASMLASYSQKCFAIAQYIPSANKYKMFYIDNVANEDPITSIESGKTYFIYCDQNTDFRLSLQPNPFTWIQLINNLDPLTITYRGYKYFVMPAPSDTTSTKADAFIQEATSKLTQAGKSSTCVRLYKFNTSENIWAYFHTGDGAEKNFDIRKEEGYILGCSI